MLQEQIDMRHRFSASVDGWSNEGQTINSAESLAAIEEALESRGSIIIEHWHYRGASAPGRCVVDTYDEFLAYLGNHCSAGDLIDVWCMHDLCTQENLLRSGKCPDDDGRVPEGGPY